MNSSTVNRLIEIDRSSFSRIGSVFHARGTATGKAVSTTCVNRAGDAGDTSLDILVGGTSTGISPRYYYVFSDIADQYWLPSVRSASSRFHSAIRCHQFASVRQVDSRLTRLVPPTLNSRCRHCVESAPENPGRL